MLVDDLGYEQEDYDKNGSFCYLKPCQCANCTRVHAWKGIATPIGRPPYFVSVARSLLSCSKDA
jgi:hypothetical protein